MLIPYGFDPVTFELLVELPEIAVPFPKTPG